LFLLLLDKNHLPHYPLQPEYFILRFCALLRWLIFIRFALLPLSPFVSSHSTTPAHPWTLFLEFLVCLSGFCPRTLC
jgi:hypothetical protein